MPNAPLSPAWRGHRPLLGRGGPGAWAPGASDPPGQTRWPGARGARVALGAQSVASEWLRPRRTAWWARTPRPSVCCLEGRERRARRVRPLSLSLFVFAGARESSRGTPTRAPAALLRVRQRSSRTTACGRRRGVCAPLCLCLSPVPRLGHPEIVVLYTRTGEHFMKTLPVNPPSLKKRGFTGRIYWEDFGVFQQGRKKA